MIKQLLLLLLLLASSSIYAQDQEQSDEDGIKQCIHQFFESLEKQDTALLKEIAFMEGQVWSVNLMNESPSYKSRFFQDDLDAFHSEADWLETPFSFDIKIHKEIAVAWVPYEFRLDGNFSHCGVDIFTLMKTEGRWKIMSAAYSVEKDGCEELKN